MVARELTFTVTETTQIVQGDAARTLADIKVGDTVTVEYTRADAETRVASRIALAKPPEAKPAEGVKAPEPGAK